jgi:hypothetical protein
LGGKITKDEKDRHFKEKLCFYCGRPNHTAKGCRVKKSQLAQGTKCPPSSCPRNDFRAQATVTQEDYEEGDPSEEHLVQIVAVYQASHPGFSILHPHSTPVHEDFYWHTVNWEFNTVQFMFCE